MAAIYVKNGTPLESNSRCESCVHAHIMRGYRESEEVVYLTIPYGPPLRVPFKVYECSNHANRNRPSWKQMEDLAIDIQPLSSAKSAGFKAGFGIGDNDAPADETEEHEPAAVCD